MVLLSLITGGSVCVDFLKLNMQLFPLHVEHRRRGSRVRRPPLRSRVSKKNYYILLPPSFCSIPAFVPMTH